MSPIVPMPAFANPNNDACAGGSVNFELDEHPVEHAADYAEGLSTGASAEDTPADREEWTKEDWQKRADELGIARSGNKATVRANVEGFEQEMEDEKEGE